MQLSTKHMKVRSNPDEARKLNRISKELTKNPLLIEVETGADHFEKETNYHFNEQMDKEGTTTFRKQQPAMSIDRNERILQAQRD